MCSVVCISFIYQNVYYEPVCNCTCLHNVVAVNASNQITAFVSIAIRRVGLSVASHFNWSINALMTQKRAHFVREKNRAEGRGEWKKDISRLETGSHVVFPLEDPLLPGFCRVPAHALIWSLLRVACMLRHCWNYASPSFSPPPHLLSTLFLFSEHLAVLLCTAFTSDSLFFCTGRPALAYYLTHLKSAIVRRIQI